MSVERGDCLTVNGSPSSSLSVGVSVPATGNVVRNSVLGVSYDNAGVAEATASRLLRTVKQGAESEGENRKRRMRGGGGKREKGARVLNANKHLMKKGILELDSRSRGQLPSGSSTLPSSLSSNSRPANDTSRPLSFSVTASDGNGVQDGSEMQARGVLVAGAGGSMRMLRDTPEDQQVSPYLAQAVSPDSGYGNTPDALKTEPQRSVNGVTVQHLAVGSCDRNRSASNRSCTSESVATTTTTTTAQDAATFGDYATSFCGGHMSLSQGGKFGVGEHVNTCSPVHSPPPGGTLDVSGGEVRKMGLVGPPGCTASPLPPGLSSGANPPTPHSPFPGNFVLSPSPSEDTQQQFNFFDQSEDPSPPTSSSATTITCDPSPRSTVSPSRLSPSPSDRMSPRYDTNDGSLSLVDAGSRDRVSPGDIGSQPQMSLSPGVEWSVVREGKRRKRSPSVTASLNVHKDGQKDYFQVTDELSRENSHFSLSEALLTVVEQYKANVTEAVQESLRGERDRNEYSDASGQESSDIYTTTPPPSSWGSLSSVATDDSMDSFALQKHTPKISLLELMQCSGNVHSAESTARRLLQFIANQYSGGMDTEDTTDTTTVLSLPVDFLSSLKQDEDLQKSVTTSTLSMRGSKEWAPPRAQLIFHVKSPSRNVMKQLASQGYRCAGCGMRQDPAQARNNFRFCNYTGKYFCQKCHTNASAVIPAHVMDRWSFKRHYVSNFAHDLLERIHYDPVFDVQNVNPQIYSTVSLLAQARDLRTQLVAVKKYLKTCRQAQSLTATFDGYIPWTADVHTYSMDDFLQIKLKIRYLKSLLSDSIKHVKSCPLCQGKGFVCEFCSSPEIIFPFELNKVSKCPYCQCCFHKQCFNTQLCPRCIRIRQRECSRLAQCTEEEVVEEVEQSSGV